MPQTGQLWYTTNAGGADSRVSRIGSDGLNHEIEASNTSTTQFANSFVADVGVDTVSGFYFALMSSGGQNALLYRGVVGSNGAPSLVVDFPDTDLINCIQVDAINHRIYVGQQNGNGDQPTLTGIRSYSYNPTTGALTDEGFISNWTNSGRTTESGLNILCPRDFALDPDSGNLFYTENLFGSVEQMGLFRVNMATGVHTQVFSESQFPNTGANGFIGDVEIDPSTDLLYFSTQSQYPSPDATGFDPSLNKIWYISQNATGGTATALTLTGLPGGSHFYPGDMTFDASTRQIYVESEETDSVADDVIYVFQLNGAGTNASLIRTITPSPALTGGSSNLEGMSFTYVPVIAALTSTSAHATEGGGTTVVLANGPTITDRDGAEMRSSTVQITGNLDATNDHLGIGASKQISGTVAGTNITLSWNAGTGTLTLTGRDTIAHYQDVMAAVRYWTTADLSSSSTRTITWTVNDGTPDLSAGSPNTGTTTLSVDAITNAAPVASGAATLTAVNEDTAAPSGQTVSTIFGSHFSDSNGDTLAGVAITANAASSQGVWQYFNGAWVTIGSPSEGAALVLAAATLVRFLPAPNFNGVVPELTAYLIDNSGGAVTTGAFLDVSVNGGATRFSDTSLQLGSTITAVNDAPIVPATATTVGGTEQIAATLLGSVSVSDVDLGARNSGNGDFAGANFTVQRASANAFDAFNFSGGGGFTVSGNALQVGGLTFATFTSTGGVLTISFTSGAATATTALVNSVINHITYANTSNAPPSSVTLNYVLNDGAPGAGQGSGGSATAGGSVIVNITAVNDVHTGGVSVTGTAAEDNILTAVSTIADPDGLGTIHYQWQRDVGGGFVNVGADQATYTLGDGDIGGIVRVVAYYTDAGGTVESATSSVTSVINASNDAPTGGVSLTGTTTENQTLTADTSTLADSDGLGTLHYDWQRDTGSGFVSTGAADQATYTLGDADVGGVVRVVVSYTDGQGFANSVTSAGTAAIANVNDVHTGGASITGTFAEDQVLTAVSTLADADGLGTLHYQWQRDVGGGFVNVGADQATYTLGDGDIGGVVRVVIYYTDQQGTVESATSSASAAISATNDAPTGGVSVTGTATEDQILTADTSTLADADGLGTLHYDWQRDTGSGFVSTGAADQATYTLGDADVGGVVRVIVSYTDGQGFANSVTSAGTSAIANVNDVHTGGVSITGTATEDQVLTAVSTLADADGLGTIHYQWQRDTGSGFVNVGADQATYTLGDADVGGVIRVVAYYTDQQGTVESATSAGTAAIVNIEDPAVARNDAVSTVESAPVSGNLFADNGSGADSDVDGPALTIASVNGSPASVGTQITLASGALLTVNADGTYSYNPNGRFDNLPGSSSGSINTATDSFTYTLVGGDTATVTVTINGEFSPTGDVQVGTGGDDSQTGGMGNDTFVGGAGNDTITGGGGADTVTYSAAPTGVIVRLNHGDVPNDGFGGQDTITGVQNVTGTAFNDTLIGETGSNTLIGGAGYDVLIGLGGDDVLFGGSGAANELYGGTGNDVYYSDANDTIVEQAGQGVDSVVTSQTYARLSDNLERLFFRGTGDFIGIGNAENNTIVGGGGNDTISGGAGYDVLIGGGGNDTISGGSGAANELYGGLGDDTYIVDAYDTIVELAGQGTDTVRTTLSSFSLGANIENLLYTGVDNFIGMGNDLANVINGRSGNDILTGGGGNDALNGGDGLDVAVLRGVAADYTITYVSGTTWTITDNVGGRDGVDTVTNIERLSFSDGTFRVLTPVAPPPPAAPAAEDAGAAQIRPALPGDDFALTKGEDDALTLPSLTGDDFLFSKGDHGPQVLPATFDGGDPLVLPREQGLDIPDHSLPAAPEPDGTVLIHHHDGWMF